MLDHRERSCRLLLPLFQYPAIIERHDLDHPSAVMDPVGQYGLGACALCQLQMPGNEPADESVLFGILQPFEIDHLQIATLHKIARIVVEVGDSADDAGRKGSSPI